MQFSKEVKTTLWSLIDEMDSDLSDFTVNPGKDFTRKKKWDFPTLVKFIISMESQSLKNELQKFFGYTTDYPTNAFFNQRIAQIYYNMNLRVLRFPISETEYEYILTNLPVEEFTVNQVKKLYAMRWEIETSFRELKYAVGLTCFHSKKREYIIQEVWARLILYNICEIITVHITI